MFTKSKQNVVLYHKNCFDGTMSAVLMKLFLKAPDAVTEFIPVMYNEPMPDVTGKNVIIVDFSYSKDVIKEAALKAASIVMLDHHLTASIEWGGYKTIQYQVKDGCEVYIHLQANESGALLTLHWIDMHKELMTDYLNTVFQNPTLRRVVHAISDRDLWEFKRKDTKVIYEALCMIPMNLDSWIDFIVYQHPNQFNKKLEVAQHYLDVKEQLAQDYCKKAQEVTFSGYTVPILNVAANFTSRCGEILSKDKPFAILYQVGVDKLYVSFRSNDKGVDVEYIAKQHGGGGHRNAAAGNIPLEKLYDLLKGKL